MKSVSANKSAKSDRLTITLGRDQRSQLEAIAGHERTSIATVIRWALDEYIATNRVEVQADEAKGRRAKRR